MARGMDINLVDTVINYDAPNYIKTYIHRAGRTARAGNEGNCYTILTDGGFSRFRKMRSKADDPARVAKHVIDRNELLAKLPNYEHALSDLKNLLEQEKSKSS